jgi:hypothetical protein
MTDASTAEEALGRHARALAEAMNRSAVSRSNETELREDVHALIVGAARELYELDDLSTRGEQRAGSSGKVLTAPTAASSSSGSGPWMAHAVATAHIRPSSTWN